MCNFGSFISILSGALGWVSGNGEGSGGVQVFLRVQWVPRVVRGVVTRLEAALAGVSLSVSGGLQDELLNLTAYHLALTNVMTTSEFKVTNCAASHMVLCPNR